MILRGYYPSAHRHPAAFAARIAAGAAAQIAATPVEYARLGLRQQKKGRRLSIEQTKESIDGVWNEERRTYLNIIKL